MKHGATHFGIWQSIPHKAIINQDLPCISHIAYITFAVLIIALFFLEIVCCMLSLYGKEDHGHSIILCLLKLFRFGTAYITDNYPMISLLRIYFCNHS